MKSDCNLWYALIPRIHVIVAPVRKMFSLANQGVTFYTKACTNVPIHKSCCKNNIFSPNSTKHISVSF